MMKIGDAYGPGKLGLSFELFPPKTPKGIEVLFQHVDRLVEFSPDYITCTYGAGGSTRDTTLDIVARVQTNNNCPVASHLTCVGATADELRDFLREADQRGIRNIVALRGDPPQGESQFRAVEGGFSFANELVALIHDEFPDFGIGVAGYPETHQEAASHEVDLLNLKRKVEAGADLVLTQLFYDNDDYFRFRSECESVGIRVPIVPGILPVTNLAQIQRITNLCGAKLPEEFITALTACGDNAESQFEVGVEFATRQVKALVEGNVPGIHFYVLNRSQATARVLEGAGIRD